MVHGLLSLVRFDRSQWWSAEELSARRDAALVKLVRHAYRRVPYYRSLFDQSGVKVTDIKTASDLTRLPVTRRKDLQNIPTEDITAAGVGRRGWKTLWTSGATATPLGIVLSPADRARFSAAFLFLYRTWGVRPIDRLLVFESRPQRLTQRSWYERLGLYRRLRVSTIDPPERWIEAVKFWKPRLVQGHAPTLKLLAEAVQRFCPDVRVPLVVNTGAILDPAGRLLIMEALGARVVDVYASAECGLMAWECPVCREHHVSEDSVVLELLEDDKPVPRGDAGEVVVTVLGNYAMPLIRYGHGDIAVMSENPPACGRGFKRMKSILGRDNDFISLPTGRRLSPHPFHALMDVSVGVAAWQLTQQEDYSLDLIAIPRGQEREEASRNLVTSLLQVVGDHLNIRFRWVETIERDPLGKIRCVISHATGGKKNSALLR